MAAHGAVPLALGPLLYRSRSVGDLCGATPLYMSSPLVVIWWIVFFVVLNFIVDIRSFLEAFDIFKLPVTVFCSFMTFRSFGGLHFTISVYS